MKVAGSACGLRKKTNSPSEAREVLESFFKYICYPTLTQPFDEGSSTYTSCLPYWLCSYRYMGQQVLFWYRYQGIWQRQCRSYQYIPGIRFQMGDAGHVC